MDDCSVLRISQNRDGTCPRKFAGLPLDFGFGLEDLLKVPSFVCSRPMAWTDGERLGGGCLGEEQK